jgi:hypothetical protein
MEKFNIKTLTEFFEFIANYRTPLEALQGL